MKKTNVEIVSCIQNGSSNPIVLKIEKELFFLKLRAGCAGENSLLSEWIGNRLGQFLGLNNQIPYWINLTQEITMDEDINFELKKMIHKSLGLNIGFKYLQDIKHIQASDLNKLNRNVLVKIFLLDLLMINIDRTQNNTNILSTNSNIIPTDYDSSLLFNEVFLNKNVLSNINVLQCLKRNPLYQNISDFEINQFLKKLAQISFKELITNIPEQLYQNYTKNEILEKLIERNKKGWHITKTLKSLKNIQLETVTERNRRTLQNRNKLIFLSN